VKEQHIIPFVSVTDCQLGEGTTLHPFVNLYGCRIGKNCNIGAYTEIGAGVLIGDEVRIGARCFIQTGVTIMSYTFVGPGVIFTNDRKMPPHHQFQPEDTVVEAGVRIGAGSIILPVRIGYEAVIGAGSVVTKDVPSRTVIYGNPAREKGRARW
jgi:acetyltransferase-like isoleucine patch superfamily enzyme